QLRQVLDGVDVVVRRWRDEPHAGRRVAHAGDPRVHLVAGELAALAGLGPLRHLDLQLAGVHQVPARHPEAPRGHLLDRAVPRVTARVEGVAGGVLAAFPGVALAADAVHGDGQGLVGLLADGAVGHGPRLEPAHDGLDRLHLVEGDGLRRRLQLHEAAQRARGAGAVVDQRAVLLEDLVAAAA